MSPRHGEPDEVAHVFDQTNGVLGSDGEPEERPGHGSGQPASSFGVPPIVAL
jgi:hypothetical protein